MLVLRYGNFETDTLRAHIEQLSLSSSVYWGWWKKAHEAYPHELVQSVAERVEAGEVRVGLVSRADERFAVGVCTGIFAAGGELVQSPDSRLAPAYYRHEPCAAWFRFISLEEVSAEAWVREFGPVPDGDPTIFEAKRERPDSYPAPVVFTEASPNHVGVLHISDLHFGKDHGYKARQQPIKASVSLAEKIGRSLLKKPACIVVSGDLTTGGDYEGFLAARAFLEELITILEVSTDAVVLIPGNHDILIDDPELTRSFSNELPFRDQLLAFYGRRTELERVHDIRDSHGHHYIIGALNSSRPRHRENMDYGYVGSDRSAPVFETVKICASLARSDVWKAVALHHHVLPGPHVEEPDVGRPVSMTLDAGEIVSLAQTYEADALLHGHQHLPFVGKVTRVAEFTPDGATAHASGSGVAVLGAGSAGVTRIRVPDPVGVNTYSLYTPFEDGGTRVECYGYLEQRNVYKLWTLSI